MDAIVAPGIPIERGIPIPARHGGLAGRSGRPRLYRWDRLEIGDSVRTPTQRILQAALHWAFTNGRTFTSRKTNKGHRVWRTA